jgi:hypothetical protein
VIVLALALVGGYFLATGTTTGRRVTKKAFGGVRSKRRKKRRR